MFKTSRIILPILFAGTIVSCGKTKDSDDWYKDLLDLKGWSFVDRSGMPDTNVFLIDSDQYKDAFNQMYDEEPDLSTFRTKVKEKADELRGKVTGILEAEDSGTGNLTSTALSEMLVPDVLSIDLDSDVKFPNGRRFDDDSMDKMLGLILNRGKLLSHGDGLSDGVSFNASDLTASFPYLTKALEAE